MKINNLSAPKKLLTFCEKDVPAGTWYTVSTSTALYYVKSWSRKVAHVYGIHVIGTITDNSYKEYTTMTDLRIIAEHSIEVTFREKE